MLRKTVGCLDHRLIRFVAQFGFVGQAASNQPCWFARRFAGPHSHFTRASGTELDVNGLAMRKIRAQLQPLATVPHHIQHRIYPPAEFTLAKTASRSPLGLSRQWNQIQHRTFFKINQMPIPQSKSPISPASSICEIPLSAIGQILKNEAQTR